VHQLLVHLLSLGHRLRFLVFHNEEAQQTTTAYDSIMERAWCNTASFHCVSEMITFISGVCQAFHNLAIDFPCDIAKVGYL